MIHQLSAFIMRSVRHLKAIFRKPSGFPFKIGDTIYFLDVPDCKSGECPDVDTDMCKYSAYFSPTAEVFECKADHPLVRELLIDEISCTTDSYGKCYRINDTYDFDMDELDDVYPSFAEAEAALLEATAQRCRVCGCTNFRACPGGCYWVEADLCSRCAAEMRESEVQP